MIYKRTQKLNFIYFNGKAANPREEIPPFTLYEVILSFILFGRYNPPDGR